MNGNCVLCTSVLFFPVLIRSKDLLMLGCLLNVAMLVVRKLSNLVMEQNSLLI